MLQPIPFEINGIKTILVCEHWKSFPPIEVYQVGEDPDPRALRQALNDARYQFYQVWMRVCGIKAMDLAKCQNCKCARWLKERGSEVPLLISLLEGTEIVAVDGIAHEVLGRSRQNVEHMHRRDGRVGSRRLAGWLQQKNTEDKEGK